MGCESACGLGGCEGRQAKNGGTDGNHLCDDGVACRGQLVRLGVVARINRVVGEHRDRHRSLGHCSPDRELRHPLLLETLGNAEARRQSMTKTVRAQGTRRLWTALATVGGLGKVRVAPGTWGTLVGALLGVPIARSLQPPVSVVLFACLFVGCSWVCAQAEADLGQHDAPAIILDEVWSMAFIIVVLPWTTSSFGQLAAAVVLFRVFDITKPQPLRQLAQLRGGWGIMADDLGAALYTVALLWAVFRLNQIAG